jgi:hypothetical protein
MLPAGARLSRPLRHAHRCAWRPRTLQDAWERATQPPGRARAQVVGKEQAILPRPIMNVALTYDHRLIDGREAVTFLKRVKEIIEDPRRLLLDV